MRDMFTKYDPATPEEHRGSPVCVVSYPEPCGERAVGEGWGCLPFCERHHREAELAAREELAETVQQELDILADAENMRFDRNPALVRALKTAGVPGLVWELADYRAHDAALAAAFPLEGREADLTDPETLAYDYDPYEGSGPVEWWSDECVVLLRFMRQASREGLPRLMRDLEGLRERAAVQLVLAEWDQERRYTAPRRAAREARERAGG